MTSRGERESARATEQIDRQSEIQRRSSELVQELDAEHQEGGPADHTAESSAAQLAAMGGSATVGDVDQMLDANRHRERDAETESNPLDGDAAGSH